MIDWTAIVAQVPVVGLFAWVILKVNERAQTSMDKRDTAYFDLLNKLSAQMDAHDVATRTAIARMEERTRPQPNQSGHQRRAEDRGL